MKHSLRTEVFLSLSHQWCLASPPCPPSLLGCWSAFVTGSKCSHVAGICWRHWSPCGRSQTGGRNITELFDITKNKAASQERWDKHSKAEQTRYVLSHTGRCHSIGEKRVWSAFVSDLWLCTLDSTGRSHRSDKVQFNTVNFSFDSVLSTWEAITKTLLFNNSFFL